MQDLTIRIAENMRYDFDREVCGRESSYVLVRLLCHSCIVCEQRDDASQIIREQEHPSSA